MTAARVGAGLAVLSWLLVATAFVLLAMAKVGGIGYDFFHLQDAAVGLAFPALGLLILRRRGSHPVGWILVVSGLSGALGVFGEEYITYGHEFRPGRLPGVDAVAWLGSWTWAFFFTLLPVLLLLFPDGRVVTRRWRVVVGAALIPAIALPAGLAFVTWGAPVEVLASTDSEPEMSGWSMLVFQGSLVMFVGVLVAAVLSLGLRWRRAEGAVRQQMKVFFLFASAGVLCLAVSQIDTPVREPLGILAFVLVPAGMAAAILRYRLYDIDRLVSRTVSYGLVTGALVGLFLGLVFVLTTLLPVEGELAAAASTLAVAALFNPLRRRVQRMVDRRFNRSRYDAEETVADFTRRLRFEVDVADLGGELAGVVAATVQPSHLSVWLRDER